MLTLSKDYSLLLSFPVNYINMPKDRVVSNTLPATIDVEIRARGFSLLRYKFKSTREEINVDLRDARPLQDRNHSFLLTNYRADKITAQFSSSIKVVRVSPDTIFLNFNKRQNKRVRVVPRITVECADEYQLAGPVRVDPPYVIISGAADVLERIDSIQTEAKVLRNVRRPMLLKVPLVAPTGMKYVELPQKTVQAIINVAKYTEASIELPVEVINLPPGYSLKTFPDKIQMRYNVAFEDYEKINQAQFRVVVDYNKIEEGSNKLRVQVIKQPEAVRAVKLGTEKVEYIIRK
jgi:YbbR domain-containing protein